MVKKAAETESTAQKSNSAVIREILDSGILKPADIETLAKEKYKLSIPKTSINQIKMAWKKAQGGASTGGGARITNRQGLVAGDTSIPAHAGAIVAAGQEGPFSVTDLELAKLALKCGGVDQLIAKIQNLMK